MPASFKERPKVCMQTIFKELKPYTTSEGLEILHLDYYPLSHASMSPIYGWITDSFAAPSFFFFSYSAAPNN
jgi:hypothetical protein